MDQLVMPVRYMDVSNAMLHNLHLSLNVAVPNDMIVSQEGVSAMLADPRLTSVADRIGDDEYAEDDVGTAELLLAEHLGLPVQPGMYHLRRDVLAPILIAFVRQSMEMLNNMS